MTNEKIKENYIKFTELLRTNIEMAVNAYIKPEYQKITSVQMNAVIKTYFPNITIGLYDMKYQVTKWQTWLDIMDFDWTERKKYIGDTFDCDNFSGSFCARASEFFNLNTAGRFTCTVTTATGEVTQHRAVLIIALDENDQLAAYVMESQNDKWVKVVKGQEIVIPNNYQQAWKYVGGLTEFN
jgi:hypothetical protein